MMADPGSEPNAGGGPVRHIPVMLEEVLELMAPGPGQTIIDATYGAGGYTRAFLDAGARVIGIDRDPSAIAAARETEAVSGGKLQLVEGVFSNLDACAKEPVDGVVLDIGVSSMQLDEADRGFSIRADGPLDMRMSGQGPDAAFVVNTFKVGDIARILGLLGEERHAGRIARMIVERRRENPFSRTGELVEMVEKAVPRKPNDRIHPATRTFQALRIFVNDELGELARALFAAERILKPGGRLIVVTFHSLEDRMVKRFFQDRSRHSGGSRHLPAAEVPEPSFERLGGVRRASEKEVKNNPRARSAKVRAGRRTKAAPHAPDLGIFGLPRLPTLGARQVSR